MRHVPIVGASWRVTLIARTRIRTALIVSEEEFLLELPSIHSLLGKLQIGISNNYLFLLRSPKRPQTKPKVQCMILGP